MPPIDIVQEQQQEISELEAGQRSLVPLVLVAIVAGALTGLVGAAFRRILLGFI